MSIRRGYRRTTIAGWIVAGIAALALTIAVAASAEPPPYMMISPGHLKTLIDAGLSPEMVDYFFNQPRAFMNMGANGKSVSSKEIERVHATYPRASIGYLFNSFGPNAATGAPGIQGFLSGNPDLANITYIQYDPEDGKRNGTPRDEAAALEAGNTSFVQQAAQLAHAHGLKFIFTPSIDVGMAKGERAYPTKYQTWLAQKRGAWAGIPGVDLYSIQSQQAEGTQYFETFVSQAMKQAHDAAPNVPVNIGIGINPSNPPTPIRASDIWGAYGVAKSNGAAGYWHNVETGVGANVPASEYVKFFQQLYSELHG